MPVKSKKKGKKVKLVIAGNYRQYQLWKHYEGNLKGNERSLYVSGVEGLVGFYPKDIEIILTGEYWKNPAYKSPRFDYLDKNLVVIKPT